MLAGGDPQKMRIRGVRQHHADLVQGQFLLFGQNEKFESAAQSVAIAHHGSQLDDVGLERDGKLEGNDLAGLQFTAEGRANAVLAEFVGSAPAGRGYASRNTET
jgi:hypothetical protein